MNVLCFHNIDNLSFFRTVVHGKPLENGMETTNAWLFSQKCIQCYFYFSLFKRYMHTTHPNVQLNFLNKYKHSLKIILFPYIAFNDSYFSFPTNIFFFQDDLNHLQTIKTALHIAKQEL